MINYYLIEEYIEDEWHHFGIYRGTEEDAEACCNLYIGDLRYLELPLL